MSESTRTRLMREEEIVPTVMSFNITTHLAGHHPGVMRVQGRLGGSYHDVGGYEGVRLYEGKPGEEGAAYHIAEAIYAEETRQRYSHNRIEARFDFSTPCKLYFFQKREGESPSRKREIAAISLPGGQSREEVCRAIALALVTGWEKPPDAAYIPPEQLTSESGAIMYGRSGGRLTNLITFMYNGRPLEAPVVCVAWSTGSMRFATIHPGYPLGTGDEAAPYYRYFILLETDRGWLLCDNGVHDLDEPLAIADRGMASASWSYDMPLSDFRLVLRSDEQATRPSYSWRSSGENHVQSLITRLGTAVTTCSLYCSECRRGWVWDADEQELHALREKGFLPALCAHCWYCADCGSWSTPTSRAIRYERFPCQHARPPAPARLLSVQDWRMAKVWRADRIRAPQPPFVQELPPPDEAEVDVLVTFHASWPCAGKGAQGRPERWKGVDIPAGTRFIGTWAFRQPQDSRTYRVIIDEEPWSIPADLVSIICPSHKRATPRAQFDIALDSLRSAAALEGKAEQADALLPIYARAVIEIMIGGAAVSELAPARLRYGHLLLQDGQVERATLEMEQAARECERAASEPSVSHRAVARIDRVLQVVDALLALGRLYLQQGKPAELLRETAGRLRAYETEISRYTEHRAILIELRLAAGVLFARGSDAKEATQLLRHVETLFTGAPEPERARYAEAMASLRLALHPEDELLARLREALAAYRGETLEQVREREEAFQSREKHSRLSDQFYGIYLRANRPSHPKDAVDLQQNQGGWGSETLRNAADLRIFELMQQGPLVAGRLLAELLLSDVEARHGDYYWDRAADFKREMTFTFSLAVGIGVAAGGRRALRYALFSYGECVLPGGMPKAERIALLADVLELGVRLLAVAIPDAPGAAQLSPWGDGAQSHVPPADVPRLARIRRYGLTRSNATFFRDYAADLLPWVRGHLSAASGDQDCQLWLGGSQAQIGPLTIQVTPRELVWVIAHEEALPLNTDLWPLCGRPECVRPEHQLLVVSKSSAIQELEARLGGKENARYAVEDGQRSGALRVQAWPPGEEAFARADFDLWQSSSAFAERYLRGAVGEGQKPSSGPGQGQDWVKLRFEQLEVEQRGQVAALWGLRTGGVARQQLARNWALALDDPFAARFVWQTLGPLERAVLYAVLCDHQGQPGVARPDLLRKTGLAPEELDAALGRLEGLLLMRIEYISNGAAIWQVTDCPDTYGPALRETGAELFSGRDHTQLTLSDYLTALPQASLAQVAQQYDIELPRVSAESARRRALLDALLDQPTSIFTELGRLDHQVQRLAAVVYEHGGRLPVEQVATLLGSDLPTLYDHLRAARFLCLLHEAFAPGGERVIFIPLDLYEACRRHSTAPLTQRQLDDFLTPTYVRDGQPWLLYDVAVFLWFVYHSTIELTQDDLVPVRVAKKMAPYLHTLIREDSEGRDSRVDLLDFFAWHRGLMKKSTMAGVKTHYLPGEGLEGWAALDVVTQARLAFLWWLESEDWTDLIPQACRDEEITKKQVEARKILVAALLTLEPGRWYATSDVLNTLWGGHQGALKGGPTSARRLSRDRWMRADGLNYLGMLASTLHELGMVALGYHHPPEGDIEIRLSPDLLQVTDVGRAVLSSTQNAFHSDASQSAGAESRPLIVQPNFDLLFLVPDLRAIYKMLPFVALQQIERTSRMRLTQDALHDGLGLGWNIDQVIATLSELSQKELPQNIVYTLREWGSKHKAARLSQAVLIEVSSEAVADAVCGMESLRHLGVRKIAPHWLAVLDPARLLDVRQALLKERVAVRIVTEEA
jgi:hypothetical protein